MLALFLLHAVRSAQVVRGGHEKGGRVLVLEPLQRQSQLAGPGAVLYVRAAEALRPHHQDAIQPREVLSHLDGGLRRWAKQWYYGGI